MRRHAATIGLLTSVTWLLMLALAATPVTGNPQVGPPASRPANADDESALTACAQNVVVERDRTTTIALSGVSRAGKVLRFESDTNPQHGVLRPVGGSPINLASIRYTPETGYVGPDEFAYVVSDGTQRSARARVSIDVIAPRAEPPTGCTQVYFDDDGHFVVNGDRLFPFGFWNMYQAGPLEGWAEYAKYFNSLTDAPSAERLAGMQPQGVYLQAESGLRRDTRAATGTRIDATTITRARYDRNIISWEVQHEPDSYPPADSLGDVATQAKAIREADVCGRPVMVTPQAGAGKLFAEYARHTDYTAIQWYPTPSLPLRGLAAHIDRVRNLIGRQPFVYVYRIAGYQPRRYREMQREPTAAEVRAATYLAAIHGAGGVSLFSYSQGVANADRRGFTEPGDARYCVSDSRDFYAGLKRLGQDVRMFSPLLLAPRSPIVAAAEDANVECAVWDVNGPLPGGEYLVCVNAADEPSPYFEYVSGDVCEQIDGYVLTPDERRYPAPQADRPLRAIPLTPGRLYLRQVHTGVWNRPEPLDRVRIHFNSSPVGTKFQLALYADEHRDRGPGRKVYESDWREIPATEGWVEVRLSRALTLEHTRSYFLALRVGRDGATILSQDVRYGARAKPAANAFLDRFPPLHQGRRVTTTITLRGGMFSRYCVTRKVDDASCAGGDVTGNQITDTFEPYAVHIYQLVP